MINLRTLEALREYAACVQADPGIGPSEKANILRVLRFHASYLVEKLPASESGKGYAILVEVESR